jgi:putative transposase
VYEADRPDCNPGELGLSESPPILLHDRDTKFSAALRSGAEAPGMKPIMLPAKSPNLNAYAERWVGSVHTGVPVEVVLLAKVYCSVSVWPTQGRPRISCLLRILPFSAASPTQSIGVPQTLTLQRTPNPNAAHYHRERNHEGKGNHLLTPRALSKGQKIHCHQQLGGLLKFYARAA